MSQKKVARLRRASKTRNRIRRQGAMRLCVFKSPRHFYAQIIDQDAGQVVVSASTVEPDFKKQLASGGNIDAAVKLGARLADKAHRILYCPFHRPAKHDSFFQLLTDVLGHQPRVEFWFPNLLYSNLHWDLVIHIQHLAS